MARPRSVRGRVRGGPKGAGISARSRVAAEIRTARLAAGISQRELAARLNRSAAWVSAAENGHRDLLLDDLPLIAEALGIDVLELLRRAMEAGR